jgi:hypothetical protein
MRNKFIETLNNDLGPAPSPFVWADLISEQMIAPKPVNLSSKTYDKIYDLVSEFEKLYISNEYTQFIMGLPNSPKVSPTHSYSSSVDLHIDAEGHPWIIEFNTNAAFLALSYFLYKAFEIKTDVYPKIIDTLQSEWTSAGNEPNQNLKIAIIDEKPTEQKLFVEFLVYQKYLSSRDG